jgi:hypothetical protein
MNRVGLTLLGVAAAAVLGSGAVVASALTDMPQEARPVQDTTADLNRQNTPPAPTEPAPEAAPAPTAPVPITPPPGAPIVVIDQGVAESSDEGVEAEDEAEKAAEVKTDRAGAAPEAPGRRQRRRVAIVEAVNKITAESMRFAVEVGGRPVMFQRTLIVSARACEVSAPDERVEDAIAYLEFNIRPRGMLQAAEPRQIFRGWMFASSPAVNGLEHPIYDAWVVGCRA